MSGHHEVHEDHEGEEEEECSVTDWNVRPDPDVSRQGPKGAKATPGCPQRQDPRGSKRTAMSVPAPTRVRMCLLSRSTAYPTAASTNFR